jgi:hypothetical protein
MFAPGEFNILSIEVAVQPFKGVLDQGSAHRRVWMSPREHHGSHVAGPAVSAAIHRTGFHEQIRMTAPILSWDLTAFCSRDHTRSWPMRHRLGFTDQILMRYSRFISRSAAIASRVSSIPAAASYGATHCSSVAQRMPLGWEASSIRPSLGLGEPRLVLCLDAPPWILNQNF